MSADMARLAAEFERFQARIKQAEVRFSGVGEMRDQLARLEAVATSPDRTVRVVAGAGGAVTDLQLTPDAMRQPAPALAATIMATLREAVAEAVRRQAGIVDETFGGSLGADVGERVREAQAMARGEAVDEVVGTAAAEPPSYAEPAAPRSRRARSDDEDDFSQDTLYGQ